MKFYLKEFNKRFSLHHNNCTSIFENKPTLETINLALSIITPRLFDSGSSLKYNNNYYQATSANEEHIICFRKGTEELIIKTFDERMYASVDEKIYWLKMIDKNKKVSETFDNIEAPKPKNHYIPSMTHPWRNASFKTYLATVKHIAESSANV